MDIRGTSLCSKCRAPLPRGVDRCPRCEGGYKAARNRFSGQASGTPYFYAALLFVLCAASVILFVYIASLRNPTSSVLTGTMKRCPADGKEYDLKVRRVIVPRGDENNYGIAVIEECESESLDKALSSGDDKAIEKMGVKSIINDPRTAELLRANPDWDPVKAFYSSRGLLLKGMNYEQVVAAIGEPVAKDIISKGAKMLERWRYGDPLYGIPIGRYVMFSHGELVEYYEFPELVRLYGKVVEDRFGSVE